MSRSGSWIDNLSRPWGDRLAYYNFPLRPDVLVEFVLPFHLTPADADRIAAFVQALALPDGTATRETTDG